MVLLLWLLQWLLFDLTIGHAMLSSIALVGATTVVAPSNHRWTPSKDRNGNVWVERQSNIINYVMSVFEVNPVEGIRLMVLACAGAGKTTLIAGLCQGFKNAILEDQQICHIAISNRFQQRYCIGVR